MGDLAGMIAKIMDREIEIESDEKRKRPKESEVERLYADISKAEKLLGWKPAYSLEEGLKETAKWFKSHKDIYKPHIYNV